MNQKNLEWNHFFKIQPSHTVSFWLPKHRSEPSHRLDRDLARKCNAILSTKAKSNFTNCFNWMQIISNKKKVFSKKEKKTFYFKLAFITLTLSDVQVHSDEYIKEHLLAPFLKWMARSWTVNSYIWKAEAQNNGNIHFHITINKFIHWKSIRAKWNRLLSAHGYCRVYQDGTNDKGNAATEIKAVINEKEIKSYILGYVTKKDIFKKQLNPITKKKDYVFSDSCPITPHYYLQENYRQIICSDGTQREYKRQIHGRLWSASQNLNESALIIKDTQGNYQPTSDVLHNNNFCTIKDFDYHKLHLYKTKIAKFFPISLREELKSKIQKLKENDVRQTYIEVESLY